MQSLLEKIDECALLIRKYNLGGNYYFLDKLKFIKKEYLEEA